MSVLLSDDEHFQLSIQELERLLVSSSTVADTLYKWRGLYQSPKIELVVGNKELALFFWYEAIKLLISRFDISKKAAIDFLSKDVGLKNPRQRLNELDYYAVLRRNGYTRSFWTARKVFQPIRTLQSEQGLETFDDAVVCWLRTKHNLRSLPHIKLSDYAPDLKPYDQLLCKAQNTATNLAIQLPDKGILDNNNPLLAIGWFSLFLATTELHLEGTVSNQVELLGKLAEEVETYDVLYRNARGLLLETSNVETTNPRKFLISFVTSSLAQYSGINYVGEEELYFFPWYSNQYIKGLAELLSEICRRRWLVFK